LASGRAAWGDFDPAAIVVQGWFGGALVHGMDHMNWLGDCEAEGDRPRV